MKNRELFKGLTPEQVEKARACKSNDELLKIAKEEGVELSEEQLQAVSGGCSGSTPKECPYCGSKNVVYKLDTDNVINWFYECRCTDCNGAWRDDD